MGANAALAEAAPLSGDNYSPERELIQRAQAADERALAVIYSTFYPKLYGYALAHLGNVEAAEDVASEVMLKVLESLHRYEFKGVAFSAWVFRIARNLLIDVQRRRALLQRGPRPLPCARLHRPQRGQPAGPQPLLLRGEQPPSVHGPDGKLPRGCEREP